MNSAQEGIARLQAGNHRFIAGLQSEGTMPNQVRRILAREHSENSRSIVERNRPAVEKLVDSENPEDPDRLWNSTVRASVKASVHQLLRGLKILEQLIDDEKLRIVGAEYSRESGVVDFHQNDLSS